MGQGSLVRDRSLWHWSRRRAATPAGTLNERADWPQLGRLIGGQSGSNEEGLAPGTKATAKRRGNVHSTARQLFQAPFYAPVLRVNGFLRRKPCKAPQN